MAAHVSERIATEGIWEPLETELVRRLIRSGDLVVDCGANIGWYTIVAAALGARSQRRAASQSRRYSQSRRRNARNSPKLSNPIVPSAKG